jgi:16S rRNA (cytidine1402-2'-O)-methyltransferase
VAEARERLFTIDGRRFDALPAPPGLHVVATPIGNLRDITLRGLETLAGADLILCEDTRHSAKLLQHFAISTPRQPLHEHNERARIAPLLELLRAGQALALISDAGTPLLSDPGFPLVRAARDAGLPVHAVPGPSALLAALGTAGLPTDRFTFVGFLPPKSGQRASRLSTLSNALETLVFYESPRRLGPTLAAMAEAFGPDREAAVALELTKRFERLERGTLGELSTLHAGGDTKGEAVILVAGRTEPAVAEDWPAALDAALGEMPLRAAVETVAARFGLKRKEVYDAALARKSAEREGRRAEALAGWFLRLKGYRIIAERVRTPLGEIDLVARRFGTTVFVEVKTRRRAASHEEVLHAVNGGRIVRAAAIFVSRNPWLADQPMRFDVISLAPGGWPRHFVNAFEG